ncbi:hypothetical protein K9L67_03100 [Candidatus Woesearchaeota archaeon]|nr:hypothetical protein [Candidatus Woesearchaeota archaeon]MCF7901189.1 hypothetical protein [Candidatus Woesearchaeota archaeon]MCF8013716.1 hypothetical protein [Candidatus Woesearchaeota archaeon]
MSLDNNTVELLKVYKNQEINVDYFNYEGENSNKNGILLDVYQNVLKLRIDYNIKFNGAREIHKRFCFIPFEGAGLIRINNLRDENMDLIYEN